MDKSLAAQAIENTLLPLSKDSSDAELKKARIEIRDILQEYSNIGLDSNLSLSDTIQKISISNTSEARNICIFILRVNSPSNAFPELISGKNINSIIIVLSEKFLADVYNRLNIQNKAQNHIKIEKLYEGYAQYCEMLSILSNIPEKIDSICAQQQPIMKAINDRTLNSFLAPYDFAQTKTAISSILTQVVDFSKSSDNTFNRKYKELIDLLEDESSLCDNNSTFITKEFYKPFLDTLIKTITTEANSAKEKFYCEIQGKNGPELTLDKKYPLHVVGKEIRIFMPVYNTGPGIADGVTAHISTDSQCVSVQTKSVALGEIPKGNFVIPVTFIITSPAEEVNLEIIISWKTVGKNIDEMTEFFVNIKAQSINIDWDKLETLRPYSLNIARGQNFYGRNDKVNSLVSYTASEEMQSSYITGQRRVGKSSLVKAVEDRLRKFDGNCYVLNTDVGAFKNPNAIKTVNALGENIFYFLSEHLPHGLSSPTPEMNGSLAPLSRVISSLEKTAPDKRFLIIIDEFDEINQEIYKSSEIAETFFLNIRSLSTMSNICFCLVGAEKMSFVMSSQGEKLNKFSRESLDTFQENEWQDYESIVKANLSSDITWLDSAIRLLYSITNGHPYFTKLICATVFENVILSRDAEVSDEDVAISVDKLIPKLDVGAFQHFWRDGIFGGLDEVEILSLKRCRVLIGIARTLRSNQSLNIDNITLNIHSKQISKSDILPILMDFGRRGITLEKNNNYHIVIPLFQRWLVNQGFNQLIADRYGDDLAEKKRKEEDQAFINDDEIKKLIDSWPTYRGTLINTHDVRTWLSQVESHINQRLLFKILSNTKIFGEADIRQHLKVLHERVRSKFDIVVTKHKAQRRKDIWITYVDGPGKSGAQLASLYAEENLISTTCVKEISEISLITEKRRKLPEGVSSIVIVDDFIGSGKSLSEGLLEFYKTNGSALKESSITTLVAVVCATPEGEDVVRETITDINHDCDLIICEQLASNHFAFSHGNSIWTDLAEMHAAKELCQRLGVNLNKRLPLGYDHQGLLVVFSRNCPNNSLPILHSHSRGGNQWRPLFERVKH